MSTRWLGVVALVTLGSSCDDKGATLSVSAAPLALGAYQALQARDACSGGKFIPCGSERVKTIDEIQSSHADIVAVLRSDELPEAWRTENAPMVLFGAKPGKSELRVKATFDDGTVRSSDANVEVRAVSRLVVKHTCRVDAPDSKRVFEGTDVDIEVQLFAGDDVLQGEHVGILTGDGLVRQSGNFERNLYTWTAPTGAGRTVLVSTAVADFRHTFSRYTLEDVERVTVGADLPETPLLPETPFGLNVEVLVAGEHPCTTPAFATVIETPDVCLGENQETSFGLVDRSRLIAKKSGRCVLNVTAKSRVDIAFELRVGAVVDAGTGGQNTSTDVADACASVSCPELPSPCPAGTFERLDAFGCCRECAVTPDRESCEDERTLWDDLFNEQYAEAASCQFDSDCTFTRLTGGCREYCDVPLSGAAISDFMAAISERYYTGCSHCEVDPATCATYPRPYCESGRCYVAVEPGASTWFGETSGSDVDAGKWDAGRRDAGHGNTESTAQATVEAGLNADGG